MLRDFFNVHISGGALIDFIEFHYAAGDALSVGEGQGNEQEAFLLEPGEVPQPWGSCGCKTDMKFIWINSIEMSNDVWIDLSSQGGVIGPGALLGTLHDFTILRHTLPKINVSKKNISVGATAARTRWLQSSMVGKEVCWIECSSAPIVDDSPQLMVELEEKTSPSKQLLLNGKHMKNICKYDVCNFWILLFELFHFGWKLKCLQSSEFPRACGWYLGRIHFLFWHLWLLSWRRCKVTEGKMIIGLDRAAPWLDWPYKIVGESLEHT